MVDFAEWTRGVSAFLRGLCRLPGRIEIMDDIQPPATDDFHRGWLASDKSSLPPEIGLFLSSASRRCCFRYKWSPPPDDQHRLSALFPNQQTLIGGGDLCEAAKYSNYDRRDWFTDSFGPSTLGLEVVSGRMEAERSQARLPLMELPNGDTISLQLNTASGTRPVVYLETDTTTEPRILSTSFEQFLLDWQRLSYIQPTLDCLAPWIDPSSGRLNPDTEETDVLSKILAGPST